MTTAILEDELIPLTEYAGVHRLLAAFASQWLADAAGKNTYQRDQAHRDFIAASKRPGELVEALAALTGMEPPKVVASIKEASIKRTDPDTRRRVYERGTKKRTTKSNWKWDSQRSQEKVSQEVA